MEPDDLLCSRNARPQKGGRGTARSSFLLAEAARSEYAPSMRAVKDSLAVPLMTSIGNRKALARSGIMARPGKSIAKQLEVVRVRKLRAVEDHSVPIPRERTSKLEGACISLNAAQ
jgi:hypothetical protein